MSASDNASSVALQAAAIAHTSICFADIGRSLCVWADPYQGWVWGFEDVCGITYPKGPLLYRTTLTEANTRDVASLEKALLAGSAFP